VSTPGLSSSPRAGRATSADPGAASLRAQLEEVAGRLAAAGVPSAAVDARWLLEHVTGVDPLRPGAWALRPEELEALEPLVERRAAREPLQLVVGETAFRLITLRCAPGVFVPRPETEVVAGLAVDAARAAGRGAVVVEPCTGTGAIACSLAAEVPGVRVVAGDRDARAVALARENAERLLRGAAGARAASGATLEIRHGALLDPVPSTLRGRVDVLVANPPYLPAADRGSWEPEVARHDPEDALVGGVDGHEVVDALLRAAPEWLAPGGAVVVEIDERRGEDARRVAREAGLGEVTLQTDLTGAVRALVARYDPGATG
jgi:release factor glutamine methyltransferase